MTCTTKAAGKNKDKQVICHDAPPAKRSKKATVRFLNKKGEKDYEMYSKKEVFPEKAIDHETLQDTYLDIHEELIERRGWGALFDPVGEASVTMVSELYANWQDKASGKAFVKGVTVSFTPDDLCRHIGVPIVPTTNFDTFCAKPNYAAIRELVCDGNKRAKWKRKGIQRHHDRMEYKYFSRKAKVYLKFICTRLMPCGHLTTLSKDRVLLTYALMARLDVNVGAIMLKEIARVPEISKGRLFFVSTLTSYLQSNEVNSSFSGDKKPKLKGDIVDISNVKTLEDEKKVKLNNDQKFDVMIVWNKRMWLAIEVIAKKVEADLSTIMAMLLFSAAEKKLLAYEDGSEIGSSEDEPSGYRMDDDDVEDGVEVTGLLAAGEAGSKDGSSFSPSE